MRELRKKGLLIPSLMRIEKYQKEYSALKSVHIGRFISDDLILWIEEQSKKYPLERVGLYENDDSTWGNQNVPSSSELFQLLSCKKVMCLIREISATPFSKPLEKTEAWINRYSLGERIDPHCDGEGSCQLLVCLDSPPQICGGTFSISRDGEMKIIPLTKGDGLLFSAKTQRHGTTPLQSTSEHQFPKRSTLVFRYYFGP